VTALIEEADDYARRAHAVVAELGIAEAWQSVGATANLVGSLRTGLLIRHLDIDFHIYSNPFRVSDSFAAVARIAEHSGVSEVHYTNLLDAEDCCLEWHAIYKDDRGDSWQLDMIHIHPDSRYVGVFERVAERISAVLTEETRMAILAIKRAVPDGRKVMGIRIYEAVLRDGVRNWGEFQAWDQSHPPAGIVTWMP